MLINAEFIKTFDPCEDGIENFEKHYPDWSGTLQELLDLENVPIKDKIWLITRPNILPENELHELACKFAFDVLDIYEEFYPNDLRPRRAIEAKRLWLKGEITDKELSKARDAAYAAYYATYAADAARDAYYAAYAAYDAARDARDAAYAAHAYFANKKEIKDKQLQYIKEVVSRLNL